MTYKIKLPVFEGPFDLLLYLIRKHEIDVYDIPIAMITRQYLEYLELMKLFDLDIAGEFIEMIATLMLIKVRMLLPNPPAVGEEEIEDPREALVMQLLEYQRFKEASSQFGELERRRRRYFVRQVPKTVQQKYNSSDEDFLQDATLYDLLSAFKYALDNMPKVTVHQVKVTKVTIEQRVAFIFDKVGERPYVIFREIIQEIKSKIELIVTVIAVLDLLRLNFFTAKQSHAFGEIRLIPLRKLSMEEYLEMHNRELVEELADEESLPQ